MGLKLSDSAYIPNTNSEMSESAISNWPALKKKKKSRTIKIKKHSAQKQILASWSILG